MSHIRQNLLVLPTVITLDYQLLLCASLKLLYLTPPLILIQNLHLGPKKTFIRKWLHFIYTATDTEFQSWAGKS